MHLMIVEDDPVQLKALTQIVSEAYPTFVIHAVESVERALRICRQTKIHCFFLDIDLGTGDGIALAGEIRKIHPYTETRIIFITAVSDRVHAALNQTHCYAYLYKPYQKEEILSLLDSLVRESKDIVTEDVKIKTEDGIYLQLRQQDILFIESLGHYMSFTCTNGRYLSRQYRLNEWEEILKTSFLRCHNRYLVNREKILNIDQQSRYIQLKNQQRIPLGRHYTTKIREYLLLQ